MTRPRSKRGRVTFSVSDYEVISTLLERYPASSYAEFLESELARADIVPEDRLPDDVVRLGTRARVLDETAARELEISVVRPEEARAARENVSALSPIGAAVIGVREGESVEWPMPSGQRRRFRVLEVISQPTGASEDLVAA